MGNKEKSCWHTSETLPQEMLDGASGKLWPTLENSDHWPYLKFLIDSCLQNSTCTSLLDVGCGAAALSEVTQLEYTGCDLPHIIEKVAHIRNPHNSYIKCDIEHDDLAFMKNFDIIVMNAFIDVLQTPLKTLGHILRNSSKFVLCHRQKLGHHTVVEKIGSYSGFSWSATLGIDDLNACIKENGFRLVFSQKTIGDYYSFLLVKK